MGLFDKFIPKKNSFFRDKWDGVEQKQVKDLGEIASRYIHAPTEQERLKILEDIYARERTQGKFLLNEAALDYLEELRAYAQQADHSNGRRK